MSVASLSPLAFSSPPSAIPNPTVPEQEALDSLLRLQRMSEFFTQLAGKAAQPINPSTLPLSLMQHGSDTLPTLMHPQKYANVKTYLQHMREHRHCCAKHLETCNRRVNDQYPANTSCELLLSQNVDDAMTYLTAQQQDGLQCFHFTESPDHAGPGPDVGPCVYMVTFVEDEIKLLFRFYVDHNATITIQYRDTVSTSSTGDKLMLELLYSQDPIEARSIAAHGSMFDEPDMHIYGPDMSSREFLQKHFDTHSSTTNSTYFIIDPRVFIFFGGMTTTELDWVLPTYSLYAFPTTLLPVKDKRVTCIRPYANERPFQHWEQTTPTLPIIYEEFVGDYVEAKGGVDSAIATLVDATPDFSHLDFVPVGATYFFT